jgi:hypothetical protein
MGNSVLAEFHAPCAIACHDAGGANQILAMLNGACLDSVAAYMEGPARILWEKAFPEGRVNDLSELFVNARTLITGTGWASDLEHLARKEAKARGIHSIAVLDHWTNYAERFARNGETVLPDELWVVDEYAWRLARGQFPSVIIKQMPDRYAEAEVRKIRSVQADAGNELVYLLEPIRSDWGRAELGEYQALRYFFKRLPRLRLPADTLIRLRPHPSDSPGKYDSFLEVAGPYEIVIDSGDLAKILSRSRWVVGCQTYAMVLALKAGKTVYCSLPPWAPACKLPHSGLVHIKDMAE